MSIKPTWKAPCFTFRIVLGLLSLALVAGTAVTLLRSDAWWIRIFDFPRIQIAVLIGITLATYVAIRIYDRLHLCEYVIASMVGLALVWQLIYIAPYTAFYPRQMSDSHIGDDSNRISILIYNVLHSNLEVDLLRNLIRENDPDLILLSEPTRRWLEQLGGLEIDYPYTIYQPQENHYGKLLYSRLELVNPEIRFLVDPEIPSFRSLVRLRSGVPVTLYGVHPRPPGLKRPDTENSNRSIENGDREDSDMRDAELLSVAKEIKELGDIPVIVAGDFNDVAWSRSTHLFQRMGGLLDPRVGRGFFTTFDTGNRFMRYPLDHVYASKHFLLVELRRLPNIGSDHFPILVILDYDPGDSVDDEPKPDAGDEQEADKAIDKGKSIDNQGKEMIMR